MYYAPGSVEISAAPYLWTILTVFAACVLLLASAALLDSELDTWVVRAGQSVRLMRARLGRMLKRRHVTRSNYVRLLTVAEIRRQIQVCEGCSCTDLCDRALNSEATRDGEPRSRYSFCPNHPEIDRYLGTGPVRAR